MGRHLRIQRLRVTAREVATGPICRIWRCGRDCLGYPHRVMTPPSGESLFKNNLYVPHVSGLNEKRVKALAGPKVWTSEVRWMLPFTSPRVHRP
jgi:hypothetical protein